MPVPPVVRTLLALVLAWGSLRSGSAAEPDTARAQAAQGSERRVVRQVDHLLVAVPDPGRLFTLLTGRCQLPVAWPMAQYGGFLSGGVFLGNVNLEVMSSRTPGAAPGPARFTGMALEPAPLAEALAELEARGIVHGPAVPFGSRWLARWVKPRWTTVSLPSVSSDSLEVFLCEYGQDVAAQRAQLREQLQSRSGGPLGVLGVREIVVGTPRPPALREAWGRLLAPEVAAGADAPWRLGQGPSVLVVPAERESIREITLRVHSLAVAREFLRAEGLLGGEDPGRLWISGPPLDGLRCSVVETGSPSPSSP